MSLTVKEQGIYKKLIGLVSSVRLGVHGKFIYNVSDHEGRVLRFDVMECDLQFED